MNMGGYSGESGATQRYNVSNGTAFGSNKTPQFGRSSQQGLPNSTAASAGTSASNSASHSAESSVGPSPGLPPGLQTGIPPGLRTGPPTGASKGSPTGASTKPPTKPPTGPSMGPSTGQSKGQSKGQPAGQLTGQLTGPPTARPSSSTHTPAAGPGTSMRNPTFTRTVNPQFHRTPNPSHSSRSQAAAVQHQQPQHQQPPPPAAAPSGAASNGYNHHPSTGHVAFTAEQQSQQIQAQTISSRIASTNAAIEAIQSVTPPVIQPVPRNRPHMELAGLPQLPGASIKGTIKFDQEKSVEVVDEVTAQKSAAEFSKFLGDTRRKRKPQWDAFWRYQLDMYRQILLEENGCFKDAQEQAHEFDDSDEDDSPKRSRPITVPYIYYNLGSFDVSPPPPVLMPDPEAISKRLQAQEAVNAHNELLRAQQHQQNQQIQQIHAQQMSARLRAAQHLKQYGRGY